MGVSAALAAFEARLAGGTDAAGYAALLRDGERHPHTRQAEEIWGRPDRSGPWSEHHRAVLFHAAAYDLELAGDWQQAVPYWARALEHWAHVHADDAFWQAVHEAGDVRATLPADLLRVHADLIALHVERDPPRARSHAALLRSAPFDAADGLRGSLAVPVFDRTVELVAAHQFEDAVRLCRTWLAVDADHPDLLRALLYAATRWNEQAGDDHARIKQTVAEVDRLIGSSVADGLARHCFWRGLVRMREGWWVIADRSDVEAGARLSRLALDDFAQARALDPGLEHDAFYHAVTRIVGDTHLSLATCHLIEGALDQAMREWRMADPLMPGSVAPVIIWAQATALDPESGAETLDAAEAQLLRLRDQNDDEAEYTLWMIDYRRTSGPLALARQFGKRR